MRSGIGVRAPIGKHPSRFENRHQELNLIWEYYLISLIYHLDVN